MLFSAGKPAPANVSSKSLVRSAKKQAREAERKEEDKPLAKVSGRHLVVPLGLQEASCCVMKKDNVSLPFSPIYVHVLSTCIGGCPRPFLSRCTQQGQTASLIRFFDSLAQVCVVDPFTPPTGT